MHINPIAQALVEAGVVKVDVERPFMLASGVLAPLYIKCADLQRSPDIWNMVVRALLAKLASTKLKYQVVASVESGGAPFGIVHAWESRRPHVLVKKEPKGHGATVGALLTGADVEGQNVALWEDVFTTGESALRAVRILTDAYATVVWCGAVFASRKNTRELFTRKGVEPSFLTTFSDYRDILRDRFSEEKLGALEDWHKNPVGWHHEFMRRNPGYTRR